MNTFKNKIKLFFELFSKHNLLTLSAALAFYTALSLAPLLLCVIAVLGLLGWDSHEQFLGQVRSVLGPEVSTMIQTIITGAKERPDLTKTSGIIGLVALLFSASGVFAQLQSSINLIWMSEGQALKSGFGFWLKRRLLSMGMVLTLGFLAIVSLGVSTALAFLFNESGMLWQAVNLVATFGIFCLLFAILFKYLPDARLPWRSAWTSGIITSILFTLGKHAIGLYIGRSAVGSAYGAAGSLLVFLVWVYYSSLIVFIGAEMSNVITHPNRSEHPSLTKLRPAHSPA